MTKYIKDLIDESNRLKEKVEKLTSYINSESFDNLNTFNQSIIKMEYSSLISYATAIDLDITVNMTESDRKEYIDDKLTEKKNDIDTMKNLEEEFDKLEE